MRLFLQLTVLPIAKAFLTSLDLGLQSFFFSGLTLPPSYFLRPHFGCLSFFFSTDAHWGSLGVSLFVLQGLMCALHCRWALLSVVSGASHFGPWSGSAAWMQRSDSALPRWTPSTSGVRCWENGGQAPGNWGRGFVPEGIPVPDYSGPTLAARCAGDNKAWIQTTPHTQTFALMKLN